jgi:acetylornithine deacetylase/succinyl-diaminopimelate desuccinylase-like protein
MEKTLATAFSALTADLPVKLLEEMVNIRSPTGEELPCAEFLVEWMEKAGLETHLQKYTGGEKRGNAIGILRGSGDGPALLFAGHLDPTFMETDEDFIWTGPIEAEKLAGFRANARIKNGMMYGNGTFNMKGGVAAFVAATAALKKAGIKLKGDIICAAVCGEIERAPVDGIQRSYQGPLYQGGNTGIRYALSHGIRADFAVITEPSGLFVSWAKVGYAFVKLTAWGQMTYTSAAKDFAKGRNAILKTCEVINAIEAWDSEYCKMHTYDYGGGVLTPHISVGAFEGGQPCSPVMLPAWCNIYLDIRLAPGQSVLSTLRELETRLEKLKAKDPELKYSLELYNVVDGTATDKGSYIVEAGLRAWEKILGKKHPGRVDPSLTTYGDDGNICRLYGIPTITCGPGGAEPGTPEAELYFAESEGEFVALNDVINAAKLYTVIALDVCSRSMHGLK